MSKKKKPLAEESDKDYLEIDLSGIKDKIDDGLDRFVYGKSDRSCKKTEGRLGLAPLYGNAGVFFLILMAVGLVLCAVFHADCGLMVFMAFMLLLCAALAVMGKYEIRFDANGFTTCFGKRVLHEYRWSDVTDVQDDRRVYVRGKRLWTDHTFDDFPEFYRIARAACKGKGKTVPSEKKRKNRQKRDHQSRA